MEEKVQKDVGMNEVNLFFDRSKSVSDLRPDSSLGRAPASELPLSCRDFKAVRVPSCVGSPPPRLIAPRLRYVRACMLPIRAGIVAE